MNPIPILLATLPALAAQRPDADLRRFFLQSCSGCHGRDGSATSPEGERLKGRNFTSAEEMKGLSDDDLARTIRKGLLFGIRMPSFKDQLSEEDIANMVRLVRGARKGVDLATR